MAIKVVNDESTLSECEIMSSLDHENIVRLLAFSRDDSILVMELLSTDLDAHICANDGALSITAALGIALGVARGVTYMHRLGVVHGDIKPANIMLDARGVPKLADFGMARIARDERAPGSAPFGLGTPPYMAPELLSGDQHVVSTATDMFSFGVLLWQLVTGKRPWDELADDSRDDAMYGRILFRVLMVGEVLPLPDPDQVGCPMEIIELIARCISPLPSNRPSASESCSILAALIGQ